MSISQKNNDDRLSQTGATSAPVIGKFSMKKEDLISICAGCQERNFSEEVDIVEKLGGKNCSSIHS